MRPSTSNITSHPLLITKGLNISDHRLEWTINHWGDVATTELYPYGKSCVKHPIWHAKLGLPTNPHKNNHITNASLPPLDKTLLRFYAKIKIKAGVLPTDCHIWQGHNSGTGRGGGYGRFSVNGKTVAAHIYIFQKCGNNRQPDHQLDHLCNNRACVNPLHLQQVTPSTNQQRKHARKQA